MSETFQILAKFLERFSDEVQGRELQEPSEDTKSKIQLLARGNLPEPEQAALFAQLNRNPEWIGWLAREVKGLRGGTVNPGRSPASPGLDGDFGESLS